ncbi:MAG: YfhO family protein [Bacteroidales bacterium]|nr:YfhO family protein [Bacteroidales bacterium]
MINFFTKMKPHLVAVVLFILVAMAFFYPQFQGKSIKAHDRGTFLGMSKEIRDYKDNTGKDTYWTNSMFGGMPSYLITANYKGNLIKPVTLAAQFLSRPAAFMFLSFLSFYILLLCYGVNPWIGMVGALAYGFSSYFLIILQAGHNSKALALAYIPAVIAGIHLVFNGKRLLGAGLFGLFLSLELLANHIQITYYFGIVILIYGCFELYKAFKEKWLKSFFVNVSILVGVAFVALLTNIPQIYYTYDYGKDSIRGKTELTSEKENRTSGLDRDYIVDWSYGKAETFNLLIPNLMGGASGGFDADSKTFKELKKQGGMQAARMVKDMPLAYWGPQPITSGPVYIGALVIFLFVFGFFFVKGTMRWWIVTATVLSIMLAWGQNFMWFTDLFLDYFPMYNKFRAVTMILVIAELTIPLFAFVALDKFLKSNIDKKQLYKALKYSVGIVGGLCLFFVLFGTSLFSFEAPIDAQLKQYGWPVDIIQQDRIHMMRMDAIRSLIFVLLGAVAIWLYYSKKIKKVFFVFLIGLFILADLAMVDRRYLNDSHFESNRKAENPYPMTAADKQILADNDPDFRVYNMTVSPFNDASTSFYHKSIGGYHGAKMRRYQEVVEHHIAKNNMQVLNMLNTKYFIVAENQGGAQVMLNDQALGNAWFVNKVKWVENADQDIDALADFDALQIAVIDNRFRSKVGDFDGSVDSLANITLIDYAPDRLVYKSSSKSNKLAVFSEVFYDKGWNAYINGKYVDHFRVNYILRGLVIPAGDNEIVFEFKPKNLSAFQTISLLSSLIIILLFVVGVFSANGLLTKLGVCRAKIKE